jgi:hypothetical protein
MKGIADLLEKAMPRNLPRDVTEQDVAEDSTVLGSVAMALPNLLRATPERLKLALYHPGATGNGTVNKPETATATEGIGTANGLGAQDSIPRLKKRPSGWLILR